MEWSSVHRQCLPRLRLNPQRPNRLDIRDLAVGRAFRCTNASEVDAYSSLMTCQVGLRKKLLNLT